MSRQQFPHPDTTENLNRPQLRLWVKFQHGKSRNFEGTAVFKNYLKADGSNRSYILSKLIRLATGYIIKDVLWQARIYEHPGNTQVWDWAKYKNEDG